MSQLFYNVEISATLTTKTPLLIGDGVTGENSNIVSCQDTNGLFYIPGATIKGSLFNLSKKIQTSDSDAQTMRDFFGHTQANKKRDTESFAAGKVRFLDAVANKKQQAEKLTRNSIDPITRTAQEGHLFTQNHVKAGSTFTLKLQMEKASLEQLNMLSGLLNVWHEQNIGRSTNNDQGKFEVSDIKVYAIPETDYKEWILGSTTQEPKASNISGIQASQLEVTKDALKIGVKLIPYSPIFTMDGEKATKEHKQSDDEPLKMEALTNSAGKPYLPASSVRGAIKAQAARIYNTLKQSSGITAIDKATDWLAPVFGSTDLASRIKISDFIAQGEQPFFQTFNAIDRFTGGVKSGALYNIKRYDVASYDGTFELDQRVFKDSPAQLAIWLMVLRDLIDGEIRFGGYQAKGFGCVYAQLTIEGNVIQDWEQFMTYWENTDINEKPSFSTLETALNQNLEAKEVEDESVL